METAIEISSVTKTYADFRLEDVSLALPVGSILGLIGQNGAGKTTLFKCVLNLIRRDSGRVRLPGVETDLSSEKIRRFVGYMPERIVFYEWMTVGAALRFTSRFYDNWDVGRCRNLLERYELDPSKKIRDLSWGMRRKLSLLQAAAMRPRVLILDEPTSGLDPVMRFNFLQDLRRIIDSGETDAVLISSHNLDEVERAADRIAVLRRGALQFHEPKRRFLDAWIKVEFVPPPGMANMSDLGGVVRRVGPGRAMIVTREDIGFLTRRLSLLGAGGIEVGRPSLQDIFLNVA